MSKSTDRGNAANRLFSSEKLLQEAIAGLLQRMPNISGVQILQGPQEYGKDLIFTYKGGLEEEILCACVVKKTEITGNAAHSSGARTVFNQAQQCLDTPHTNMAGIEVPIETVYVMSPFDLSPTATNSIRGQLKDKSKNVKFICGTYLFSLFKKYWPDYLADEAAAIDQHLKNIVTTLENHNPLFGVAMNYDIGKQSVFAKKVYVPQAFFIALNGLVAGSVVTESVPSSALIGGALSVDTLRRLNLQLENFQSAVEYLQGWGLVTNGDIGNISAPITNFLRVLEDEWRHTVVHNYEAQEEMLAKRENRKFRRVSPASWEKKYAWLFERSETKLGKTSDTLATLGHLVSARDATLSSLELEFSNLDQSLSNLARPWNEFLSDSQLPSVMNLLSCAQAAPDGLFKISSATRVKLPSNLLDTWNGSILIVGAAGYGKTSFCRWNALRDAERYSLDKAAILPVYIPLHQLSGGKLGSFENAFLTSLHRSALVGKSKATKNKEGKRIRLYLDGLDEVPSDTRKRQIVELAQKGVQGREDFQVVLTARNHVHGPYLSWLPRLSLAGFKDEEVKNFINQWLAKNDRVNFYEQLNRASSLANLMHVPLLATLIVLVFRQTGSLPENRTRLYQVFVELLSGGWDMAKRMMRQSRYEQVIKLRILQSVAAKVHQSRRREFGNQQIIDAIENTFSKSLASEWKSLRDELVSDGLITKSAGVIQFAHLSFQEFLAAKQYKGEPSAKLVSRALEAYLLGDSWWKEVIIFYIGLSDDPTEIGDWLVYKMKHLVTTHKEAIHRANVKQILLGITEFYPHYPIERHLKELDVREVAVSFPN